MLLTRGSMLKLKNCHVLRQENGIRMNQNQREIMIYYTFLWCGLQLSSFFFESWNLGEAISIIDSNWPFSVWTLCHWSPSCHATLQLFGMSAHEITRRTLKFFFIGSWSYVWWNFYDNFENCFEVTFWLYNLN